MTPLAVCPVAAGSPRARRVNAGSPTPARGLQKGKLAVDAVSADAAVDAADAGGARSSPLAALLAGHVLRDGEVVILVLKPSPWFVVFQSIFFAGAVALLLLSTRGYGTRLTPLHHVAFIEAAVFAVAGRLMWAALQWMGRLYVLTDQRVIRMSGVFNVEFQDCPLRKVARTRITATLRERLVRIGSVETHSRESAGESSGGKCRRLGLAVGRASGRGPRADRRRGAAGAKRELKGEVNPRRPR